MLDGFRKSDVAPKLADMYVQVCITQNMISCRSDFGHAVAHEYLNFFEFEQLELDECLRQFLVSFTLSGETQERERVMIHFSNRYFQCNPYSYPSNGNIIFNILFAFICNLFRYSSRNHMCPFVTEQ